MKPVRSLFSRCFSSTVKAPGFDAHSLTKEFVDNLLDADPSLLEASADKTPDSYLSSDARPAVSSDHAGHVENTAHQRHSEEFIFARSKLGLAELPRIVYNNLVDLLRGEDKGSLRANIETLRKQMLEQTPLIRLAWSPQMFKLYSGVVGPSNYGPARRILHELQKRMDNQAGGKYQPTSIMDFGTGPGTALWAAYDTWGGEGWSRVTGIDVSQAMLDIAAKSLFNPETGTSVFPNAKLAFSQYVPQLLFQNPKKPSKDLPHAHEQYDIVVMNQVLGEFTDEASRKLAIETLWKLAKDFLIISERGNPTGFNLVLDARNYILNISKHLQEQTAARELEKEEQRRIRKYRKMYKEDAIPGFDIVDVIEPGPNGDFHVGERPMQKVGRRKGGRILQSKMTSSGTDILIKHFDIATNDPMQGHVFAPCPHDGHCPMTGSWCHFSQKTYMTESQRVLYNYKDDASDIKFSYVILRKGPRPSSGESSQSAAAAAMFDKSFDWPRLVASPYKQARKIQLDLCTSQGNLQRILVPKSQGKLPYTDARKASWGDLWPHPPATKPIVHTNFDKFLRKHAQNAPNTSKNKFKRNSSLVDVKDDDM